MKMVKSLLLGSAAGLVAIAGAQAADLPVKAKPVQYVKICSLYGAGFYYIPGTDTCIKVGGYVRAEANYQANGSFKPQTSFNFDSPDRNREISRSRAVISLDVRSQTAYGTLRAYTLFGPTDTPGPAASVGATGYGSGTGIGGSPYMPIFAPAAFIQFAGFTFGKTASFFDFDLQPYSNQTNLWGSNQAGNGEIVFAYTAQFGGGFSASISAEDTSVRRVAITGSTLGYQGRRWPDVVGNLRVDQAWGSAQIMGAIHDTAAFAAGTAATQTNTGWAIGAGARFNLPTWGHGDYLLGQVAYADGAMNYVASQFGAGGLGAMNLQDGFPGPSNIALGPLFDAVGTSATNLQNTKGWSVTGGYEHVWNPQWKTSLYGSFGQVDYDRAAGRTIAPAPTGGLRRRNADWSMWQIGSRTVWTPVQNLDLSVDLLYTDVSRSAFNGGSCEGVTIGANGSGAGVAGCTFDSKGIFSAMARAQRNFWP